MDRAQSCSATAKAVPSTGLVDRSTVALQLLRFLCKHFVEETKLLSSFAVVYSFRIP